MRKVLAMALVCVMMAGVLGGCGSDKQDGDKTAEKGEETTVTPTAEQEATPTPTPDQAPIGEKGSVSIGEYKGIAVTESITEVSDEDVQAQIDTTLEGSAAESDGTTVEDGDMTNIDFVGKIDGVEFDGGSATGQDLVIGSNSFIEGFETGMIGMKVGETKDISVTFPEDYYSSEYAGKDAVFTVTLNSIKKVPELTDEWVAANTEYKTVNEYRTSVKQQLQDQSDSIAESTAKSDAWQQVLDGSTVETYDKSYIEAGEKAYDQSAQQSAQQYNLTMEQLLQQAGITQDEYDADKESYGKSYSKEIMVINAIAEKEDITSDSEAYKATIKEGAINSGYTDSDEDIKVFKDSYVENLGSEENFDWLVKKQCIINVIWDNAKITKETAPADAAAADVG